ncbi:MAG: hypothetical protein II942_03190 [Alphaproteobacteria bacterium]|nr:hypothetical protein [Alphaproteobacteria bacterium]
MFINIVNQDDFKKYVSLEICAQDLNPIFRNFNKSKHTLQEIIQKKEMLSEFMAIRYLQDRLCRYWQGTENLPFLRPVEQGEDVTSQPEWVTNALNNHEKIYVFDSSKMPSEIQTEIRRVGLFLKAMAGEHIDQVVFFSRKTGRPPKVYLDYLKGKHDYPDYIQAVQQTLKWECNELIQNKRNAKVKRIMDLPNGYYAVQLLNAAAMKLEGYKMANCLSDDLLSYLTEVEKENPDIIVYSIRNSQNIPRVNVTVRPKEKIITDCAGKANDLVHPVDIPAVASFVNALQLPMRTAAAHQARLLRSNGQYYDVFHLPTDRKFYESSLNLEGLGLTELPSLENVVLSGSFMCAHNQLRNLKGAPKIIRGGISFYDNPIENLSGFPDYAGSAITPIKLDDKAKTSVSGEITLIPRQISSLIKSNIFYTPYLVHGINE